MSSIPNDYRARIRDEQALIEPVPQTSPSGGGMDKIDKDKIISVFRRSLLWVVLIMLLSVSAAYLVVRYTKPLFESYSDIKLAYKSEASQLGFGTGENVSNFNFISGEIELLKSRLFFSQVLKALPLEVSYYTQGNFLDDEKYRESPFIAHATVRKQQAYDKHMMVTVHDEKRYSIKFPWDPVDTAPKEYVFGETISFQQLDLRLEATENLDSRYIGVPMYFILNSEGALLQYIGSNLEVSPLNLSANTIRISFKDFNRYKARDMVDAINSIYQTYTRKEKQRANNQKIDFLNDQLTEIEEKLDEYEDYFENFTIDNRTTNLDSDLGATIRYMTQLDSMILRVRSQQSSLNKIFQVVLDSAIVPSQSVLSPQLNTHLSELHDLQVRESQLLQSHNARTLVIRRHRQDIQFAKEALLDAIDGSIEANDAEIRGYIKRRAELNKTFVKLPSKGTEFNQAQRYYNLYEAFYLKLMERRTEFQIAQAGTTTEFVILSPGSLSYAPISPSKVFVYGAGVLGGALISVLLVGLLYLMHNTITGLEELEKLTAMPVLGGVPSYKGSKLPVTRMIISKNPKSSISEAFRSIRTNLEFISGKDDVKTISITSTISGEGKTFVCVNLAGILSLSDKRVVIVDLDMRRPRVHMAFEKENTIAGTSTVLIGKHSIEEALQPTDFKNLSYIPVGPTPPNPSELLLGSAFEQMIDELKGKFDIIVFDTPPIGLVTDGVLVMKKIDLPIYVFRADYSKRVFAKTLQRLHYINRFKNMAVVLNAMKSNSGQGYGYGYGYTYGYYQDGANSRKSFFRRIFNR